jgi:arylsulfatase A-like enzyme
MAMPQVARTTFLCGWLVLACAASGEAQRPPNVVLIISDDQAWTDFGFMGHAVVETPHLDRLAEQSALFTRGYVTTALCRPSLATLATGLYAHQHGISGNDVSPPAQRPKGWRSQPGYAAKCERLISKIEAVPTLPRLLARKGYVSHQSGKWWEGHHSRGGFTAGMTHGDVKRGGRHGDEGLKVGRKGMKPVLDFVDAAGDKPFFVWYAPFLPHTPHTPPERLLKKYQAPDRPFKLARYYAMCEWFDETCGTLLGHLDKRGLAENTMVMFIVDNGWVQRTDDANTPDGWRQNYMPRSKLSPFESGVRSPVMIRWPGRIKPRRDEQTLVSSVDVVPTILQACGLAPTESMRGLNLLPFCQSGTPQADGERRNTIFGELFAHDVADIDDPRKSLLYRWCIAGQWKLLQREDGVVNRYRITLAPIGTYPKLYDLSADPHERHDVSKMHPEIVARLQGRIRGWW